MVKRLLQALNYSEAEKININDENQVRKAILWIEANVIKKDNKNTLRSSINSQNWATAFDKYKSTLGCPSLPNITEELNWIAGYAVQQEYSKKKDVYEKHAVENIESTNVPSVVAENPLDKLDFHSKEFIEGINGLCKILKLSPHPDPLVNLKAVSKIVSERLSEKALENPKDYIVEGTPFPFQDLDMGFNLGDPVLNHAAKVLRLIYIHNLRDLQTKANELIVAVQNVTANPKTDTKLGQVGR